MRKLFNEFFYIPKHGKVREKVMLTRLTMTITIIIMCLAAMSITAYAYFSCNVTSGFNIIKAANFDLTVSVTVTNNETTDIITATNDNTYMLTSGTYTVSLKKAGTAKTGFCIVETTVGDTKTIYHTQQIGKDVNSDTSEIDPISFTLDLTEITGSVTVQFTPHWGTSSYYGYANLDSNPLYIKHDSTVKIGTGAANSVGESDEEKETTSTEITMPTTEPAEIIHEVRSGDTLWGIAQKYGTSVEALKAYNKLTNDMIQVGQQIKIPPADWVMPESNKEQNTTTSPETTPPSTEATETSEPTSTTEPSTTTEPTTTLPTETTEQTQLATEITEITDVPTTEASE